jgi:hypothetical protein
MSEIPDISGSDSTSSEFGENSIAPTDTGWEIGCTEFDQKIKRQRAGLIEGLNLTVKLSLILSKYQVELEPIVGSNGWNAQCCCPFPDHHENTPSFYFNQEEERFNCFGCHRGGKAIEFISTYEGISRSNAAEKLAQNFNPSEIQQQVRDNRIELLQSQLFEIANQARELYQKDSTLSTANTLEKIFETLDIYLRVLISNLLNLDNKTVDEFKMVVRMLEEKIIELKNG